MKSILSAVLALGLLAPSANAGMMSAMASMKAGGLKLGAAEIHPYAGITESYDSNIYLVPEDQASGARVGGGVRSAWITRPSAGFGFKLPVSGMHSFDGGYGVAAAMYSKQGKTNDYVEQKANVGYGYKGPMGLSGRLGDSFLFTRDPAFSEQAGDRQQRWQNTVDAKLDYAPEGGRLVAGITGSHTAHKYTDGLTNAPVLNRYEQMFGVTGGYKIQPKTKVWVGYRRGIVHYNADSRQGTIVTVAGDKNSKSHFFEGGVDGELAAKLKGSVSTGMSLRKYDQANAGRTAQSRNWILGANLVWAPRATCLATLALSRGVNESTFGTNRFSIENSANAGFQHKFPWKVAARVKAGMAVSKYPEATGAAGTTPVNRRDDTYTQGAGVDYDVQDYLKVSLDYDHSQRFSKFSGQNNYERHLTMLSAKLQF